MARDYPEKFRCDVVEIARKNRTSIAQIAMDFGISDAVIRRSLVRTDIEDGLKPVATVMGPAELQEATNPICSVKMDNEVLGRAVLHLGRGVNPQCDHLSCVVSRSRGSGFRCLAGCWVFPAKGTVPDV